MKKILLGNGKKYYKANLHCHSTISDGKKTPKELKEMYMSRGYSIIAYTDHDIMLPHFDLTDENFLPLTGFEIEIEDAKAEGSARLKNCHLCYIAIDPDNVRQVCYHRSKYYFGNSLRYKDMVEFDSTKPDFERERTHEGVNRAIQEGRENGFFVTYNHPGWSFENFEDYGGYHGMHAMEISNYGCIVSGYADYNEKEYDHILRNGERIYCISTDDNHNREDDSFGGFVMINADRLAYRTITKALTEGSFYASQGPEIYEVWYEDGKIGIRCSACASIRLNTEIRHIELVCGSREKPVCEAVFDVKDAYHYVRLTVTDFDEKHANTNAFFVDEFK